MTVSLPFLFALFLTLAAWTWAFVKPVERTGRFDFSPLVRVAYMGVATIVMLAAWLAYMAWRVWGPA